MKSKQFYDSSAWQWRSKLVKLTYCDNNYMVKCFTCGHWMLITDKSCHAGHFLKVFNGNNTNFSIAFDIENIGINCYQCNRYFGGRPEVMEKKLIELHGQDKIDMLYIKRRNPCKLDRFTLSLLAKEFRLKFYELVKTKGNPWK